MTKRCLGISVLLLWLPVALLAGCASEGTYRGAGSAGGYNSYIAPALSGTDPALRDWYTAPYFDPYEMP
jgi:hypothetical protein